MARELKNNDKMVVKMDKGKNICMICFDFQKVLNTPKSDASCLYYKRKLSTYNFTIYDVGCCKGYCYVWTEDDAKRGSNEVTSCLLHFIEMKVTEGIKHFYLWSDNCAGQNRNKNLISMFIYASANFNINIKHTFLEVGHTQNEGDSVHANIERYSSKRHIYSSDECVELIKAAKQTGSKYNVV